MLLEKLWNMVEKKVKKRTNNPSDEKVIIIVTKICKLLKEEWR